MRLWSVFYFSSKWICRSLQIFAQILWLSLEGDLEASDELIFCTKKNKTPIWRQNPYTEFKTTWRNSARFARNEMTPPFAAITPQFARRLAGALIVVIWVLVKPLNRKPRRLIRRFRAKPPQNCSLFNGFSRKDSKETIRALRFNQKLNYP